MFFFGFLAGPPRAARGEIFLQVRDARGREVARLGGPFSMTAGTRLASFDLPRSCDGSPPNGFSPRSLAPGPYRALLYFNGHRQPGLEFHVKALQGSGRIKVTMVALEDAEGRRRSTFSARDRGVYARVGLVNLNRDRAHDHLVQVEWAGPDGPVGRTQGGLVRLERGETLDDRDFPWECDPQHHDGILIQGTSLAEMPGRYRMRVLVDGALVVEVPFILTR